MATLTVDLERERYERQKTDAEHDADIEELKALVEAKDGLIAELKEELARLDRRLSWVEDHTDFRGRVRRPTPEEGG